MTPTPLGATTSRDRLLDTAARMFYEQGVHVGIDTVCRSARVSKRSLYEIFGSKDALVAASLEHVASEYRAALLPPDQDGRTARDRILHVFHRLQVLEPQQHYLGCPFVAAAVQLKSPEHPASVIARRQKDGLTDFFRREAALGGADDPELLSRQLTLVFDGASARSVVQAHDLDGLAVTTATALLDAAGVGPDNRNGSTDPATSSLIVHRRDRRPRR